MEKLTEIQEMYIETIKKKENQTVREIAKEMGVCVSTAHHMLVYLTKKGILYKNESYKYQIKEDKLELLEICK